jgi:methanethiol S-methyltransferase
MLYPIVVFLTMGAWGVLHSWLAAFSTKQLARRFFGESIDRYYRLIFIGIAILTLIPILAMVAFLPSRLLWVIPTPWRTLTLAVQFLALVGILITVLQTDLLAFAGFKQLRDPNAEMINELVKDSVYGLVRHPMYLFSILLFWLFPVMTDLMLAFFAASTLYFLIGTIPEEEKLVEIYGEDYKSYQEEVPRIIPGLKF